MAWENAQIPGSPYYPWSSTSGPVERAENKPQASSTNPKSSYDPNTYRGTTVVMPGYGQQCAMIGFQRDPRTGTMTNIQVMYGGGLTKTFATEGEYLAFCGGGGAPGAAQSYPGVPSGYAPAPQASVPSTQNINVTIPQAAPQADSHFMDYWLAQQAARDADRNALLTALTARTGGGGQVATPQPATYVPSYQYTPSSDSGGIPTAPVDTQMTPAAAAPESTGTPAWVWLALGGLALYAFGKKKSA